MRRSAWCCLGCLFWEQRYRECMYRLEHYTWVQIATLAWDTVCLETKGWENEEAYDLTDHTQILSRHTGELFLVSCTCLWQCCFITSDFKKPLIFHVVIVAVQNMPRCFDAEGRVNHCFGRGLRLSHSTWQKPNGPPVNSLPNPLLDRTEWLVSASFEASNY